jgi:hypothetical protein
MPDNLKPSEFGGKVQKNRVQPAITPDGLPGHLPTASEQMMLTYTTGDTSGLKDPDNGAAWNGFIPYDEKVQEVLDTGIDPNLLADDDPEY